MRPVRNSELTVARDNVEHTILIYKDKGNDLNINTCMHIYMYTHVCMYLLESVI